MSVATEAFLFPQADMHDGFGSGALVCTFRYPYLRIICDEYSPPSPSTTTIDITSYDPDNGNGRL